MAKTKMMVSSKRDLSKDWTAAKKHYHICNVTFQERLDYPTFLKAGNLKYNEVNLIKNKIKIKCFGIMS